MLDSLTSSVTLNHGDILVMDGSAQTEYLHCSATHCVLSTRRRSGLFAPVVCARFSRARFSILGERENNGSFSWGLAFLLFILMSVPLVSIWMNIRKGCRHSGQRPPCLTVHLSSRGRARWVGRRRWSLSRRCQLSKKRTFYFPGVFFWGTKLCLSFHGMVFRLFLLLDLLAAKWEPTPCYRDAYSVGIPKGACGEKSGPMHYKTTSSPRGSCVFWLVNGLFIFLECGGMDASYWSGKASWA